MERKVLCILLLFLCFKPTPALNSPLGLLQDGGFETWDDINTLTYWKNQGSNCSLTREIGGRPGTSGVFYPRIEITQNEDYDDYLVISLGTVSLNELLNASIYMNSSVYDGEIEVTVHWYNGNTPVLSQSLIRHSPGTGKENSWILVFPENDSDIGSRAWTVPSGVNNATISILGQQADRSPRGSTSPQQPYYVWLDDLTLFGSAMDEFTATTSVVVFLIVTSIVTVVLVRKKS